MESKILLKVEKLREYGKKKWAQKNVIYAFYSYCSLQ